MMLDQREALSADRSFTGEIPVCEDGYFFSYKVRIPLDIPESMCTFGFQIRTKYVTIRQSLYRPGFQGHLRAARQQGVKPSPC